MAKKKRAGKGNGDADEAAREEGKRTEFAKILKALCQEYKVKEQLRGELETAFSVPEGKDPPIKKMLLSLEHDEASVRALCATMKGARYEPLTEMLFVNCGFGDKTASLIADTMRFTNIERLELRDCGVGVGFAQSLAEFLSSPVHCRLKKLVLDYNPLGSEGAHFISKGLEENRTLKYLSLSYCEIEAKGGKYLGQMLLPLSQQTPSQSEKSLETLIVSGNPFRCAGIGMLAQGLSKNRTLKALDLENTSFGHDVLATQALSEACAQCTSLTSLNIHGNLISNAGAKAFYKSIEHTSHITDVKLTQFVDKDLYAMIKDWAAQNRDLKKPKKKGKSKKKKK